MIGQTLGHYRIEARLGSGAMGVVYRAGDERLQRTVALKLLGGTGTGSTPQDRSRLLDEARAASHLNHPHICTVYEVGEVDGLAFIAMEFVDGRPLSELVPSHGLPVEPVLRYGTQIAGALAHAHERGVVHRDLKTANVVVSDEHGAKVLDFGVARRLNPREADALTRSVEAADAPSRPVGTLAYIAPEVLLGGVADSRSDIWALGVVLHELATGTLPFTGRNEFEITAGILRAPVPPFPAHVPPMMRGIIQRCLAKEPAQRYQRAGEVRAALEAVQSDAIPAAVPIALSRSRRPWLIGLVAVAIAALILLLSQRSKPSSWEDDAATGQLTRIVSTEYETFDPSLSPDGRMLAYAAMGPNGSIDLYSSRVAGGARLQLTNDDAREASPKFSPDGERIAFTRRDGTAPAEIRILPTLGGVVLASIPGAAFPAWSPDGRRLAYLRRSSDGATELTTSLPDGGDPRVLMRSDSAYPFLRNPAWSPDGRLIAVVKGTGGIAGEIWLQPVDGGPGRRAIEEPSAVFSDSPVFTPDGTGIIHASNRGGATNIWMLSLAGDAPIRLTTGPGADESPSVAADRAIAFVNSRWRNTLDIRDHTDGSTRTLLTHAPFLWGPAISPNGKEVAFSRSEVDGSWHVWVIGLQGGTARQLTSGETGEVYSRYSPDGAFLLFHTWGPGRRIGRVSAEGGPVTFLPLGGAGSYADVSPDGKMLVFVRPDEKSERIYTVPIDGGDARLLTPSPASVPRFSPKGDLIAFAANRDYRAGIFVINRDGTNERRLTSEGSWPVWWPDGQQIAFLTVGPDGDQEIRVTTLDGTTRTLDRVKLRGTNLPFDVLPDGRRIVVTNAVHVSDEIWLRSPAR